MADEKQVVSRRDLGAEILECQRARSDLLKWKLVLVAGVGAAGLGLVPGQKQQPLLLALIPFVCVYVDLLCSHQWLQIHVIAAFLRRECAYEKFLKEKGKDANAFALEKWALYGSTILLCIGTAILSYVLLGATVDKEPRCPWLFSLTLSAVALGSILSFTTILYNAPMRLPRREAEAGADTDADEFALKEWAFYASTSLLLIAITLLVYAPLATAFKHWWISPLLVAVLGLTLSLATILYNESNRYEQLAKWPRQSRALALEKGALYGSTILLWLGTAVMASPIVGVRVNQERDLWLILGATTVGLVMSFITMGYFYHRLNRIQADLRQ